MKQPTLKKSVVVTIKSPKLKFNDIGYLVIDGDHIKLQLYSAGESIEEFEIDHLVCTQAGCMSKSSFNEEYLSATYEDDFLQNILLHKPLFDGKNLTKREDGFEQHLVDKSYNITYRVYKEGIYFRDTKNRILIKITDVTQKCVTSS